MTCLACSKEVPEIAAFCPHCGKAIARPRALRVKNAALWLATLLLAFFSLSCFLEIGLTLSHRIIPSTIGIGTPTYPWVLKAGNGGFLCGGIFFLGLSLLTLDTALRGRIERLRSIRAIAGVAVLGLAVAFLIGEERGRGSWLLAGGLIGMGLLVSWKLKSRGVSVGPLLAATLSLGSAAGIGFGETVRHSDGEDLGRVAAEIRAHASLSQAGDHVLGRVEGGPTHLLLITPDLVRAFNREGLGTSMLDRPEFLAPGWAPLWVLAAALLLERLLARSGTTFTLRLAAVFGAVGLFVVTWTAAAQQGIVAEGGYVQPFFHARFLLVLFTGAAFLRFTYVRMAASDLAARGAWAFPYFFFTLAAPIGVVLVTPRTPGNPLLVVPLVFAGLGALAWDRVVRPRPGDPA